VGAQFLKEEKMYIGQTVIYQVHKPMAAIILEIDKTADPKLKRVFLRMFNQGADVGMADTNHFSDYSELTNVPFTWRYTEGDEEEYGQETD